MLIGVEEDLKYVSRKGWGFTWMQAPVFRLPWPCQLCPFDHLSFANWPRPGSFAVIPLDKFSKEKTAGAAAGETSALISLLPGRVPAGLFLMKLAQVGNRSRGERRRRKKGGGGGRVGWHRKSGFIPFNTAEEVRSVCSADELRRFTAKSCQTR